MYVHVGRKLPPGCCKDSTSENRGYLSTSLLVSSANTILEEEEPPQEQQLRINPHPPHSHTPANGETFHEREKGHQQQHPKLLVKVEESPIEETEEEEKQVGIQKNPITAPKSPSSTPGRGTKAPNYHNKAFYLHNHPHNNNHQSHLQKNKFERKHYSEKEKGGHHHESVKGHHQPFSPLLLDNNTARTCPNCNYRIVRWGGGASKTVNNTIIPTKDQGFGRNRNSIFRQSRPPAAAGMEPQNPSMDLHRKLDEDDNINGGGDEDDDLLEDQVRPSTLPGGGILESEYDEGNDEDDEEEGEVDENAEMNREDLIRFLLANSGAAAGGSGGHHHGQSHHQQNYHFQQHLQQQLLQQQWNAGPGVGRGIQRGISASSSIHGAVGGVGLEPIMDASFQDDNFDDYHSDYQWFTESGFETDAAAVGCSSEAASGVVPEFPVSLLGETGHGHHHGNNAEFDATMAQIDIEDFHSEDILLRLPPLCASDLQEDDQIAQSMDMSICKSENLFSPMNENQEALPLSTFSTDSLDTRAGEILATCMTNRNNYTIAFQGMEESASSSTYKTAAGEGVTSPSSDILENDSSGMMTNWRQVTSNNSTGSQRGSVDNNNGSNESSTGGMNTGAGTPNNNCSTMNSKTNTSDSWTTNHSRRSLMTQSCPHPPRNNNMMIANNLGLLRTNPAAAIKLFDIQNVQTVQLAQIYQRHIATTRRQQLGCSGSPMTDSGSLSNLGSNGNANNNNNNPGMGMMMMTSGSSLSSGRHNTPQILEESWNNNRNPILPSTPTHYHHPHHHPTHHPHHPYSKYNRSRRHSSSTNSSSSHSQPTTTQLADAVRKLRSIEIQTSITLVPQPPPSSLPHHPHQKLYSSSATGTNDIPGSNNGNASHHPQASQGGSHYSHHQSSHSQQPSSQPPPVYICYPSYTLPDLRFLEQHRPKNPVILMPQRYKTASRGQRTQSSMGYPPSTSQGFGGGGQSTVPRGRRPLSCNDVEELRVRDLSHVKDWPSLNFLLPKEYQAILAEIKPPEKREQWDDSEKDTADIKEDISCGGGQQNTNNNPSSNNHHHENNPEEAMGGGGGAAAGASLASAGESPVIMRRRVNGAGRAHPTKRYSMNDAAGFLGQHYQQQPSSGMGITSNRNRHGLAEKFKRFSLQETLPEVAEITSEIAKNLEQLESLALTATSAGGNHHHHHHQCADDSIVDSQPNNNNCYPTGSTTSDNGNCNIPSYVGGGISSSEESTTTSSSTNNPSQQHHHHHHHHHRRVPTNTPKTTSFVDFDNHFQLRNHAFFDDGGAAAAARIIAHVAPMCPGSSSSSSKGGGSHSQKAPIDMAQKQSLTDAVAAAVNQIQSVWETTQAVRNVTGSSSSGVGSCAGPNPSSSSGGALPLDNKNRLTPTSEAAPSCLASPHKSLHQCIMSQTPAGKVVLECLCPALYSLLSDGLCPFLETIFGRVPNTVWRVVEASIQYGPTAQSLNELVLRINSEELLAEGPMKFNAFVCGLLNLRNLGSWLTFLRTKERLLRTHYEQDAFMYLCNTTTRFLYDQMLVNMHHLSKSPFPPFQLDIFHETKLLHQSMNPVTPTKSLPASLPVSRKNSVKGSTRYNSSAGTGSTGSTPRKSTSADARPVKTQSKNSKYHANQLKKSQMKRSFSDERPKTARAASSTIPKSKTAQNITHERGQQQQHGAGAGGPTSAMNTRLLSRFPSRPKISNYSRGGTGGGDYHHHHHSVDDEGREKGMSEPTKAQRPKSFDGSHLSSVAGGGGSNPLLLHKGLSPDSNKDSERFRRLQMQWELLSSDESKSKGSPGSSTNVSNITAPSLAGSKIPRPINSPTRASIATHLGNVRPSTGISKR